MSAPAEPRTVTKQPGLNPLPSARHLFLAVALVGVLIGCASTKMESTLNPEAGDRRFQRILVEFNLTDLEDRVLVENTFAEASSDGTIFRPSHAVVVTCRVYRVADMTARLTRQWCDAGRRAENSEHTQRRRR